MRGFLSDSHFEIRDQALSRSLHTALTDRGPQLRPKVRRHHSFVMSTGHKMDRVEYAPEVLKLVLDDMVTEAGVQPLLHASLLDAACVGRRVQHVRVLTKGGIFALEPRVLVDSSGDMDAVKRAGVGFLDLEEVPGCERGRLVAFGTQVGIRETRRVEGDHVLTADELLRPEQFDDAIAAGAYPIDIHPAAGGELQYSGLGDDHAYQIPYRSLVPRALDNALVAGRGLSATHKALAAVRVMTISMAVGQAAGTAAALAARDPSGANVRHISMATLRRELQQDRACLS